MEVDRLIIICECHSPEHQVLFWYDDEDDELYCEVHLSDQPFFRRLWGGLKYIFGYKSRYGNWDNTIFSPENCKKLRDYLNKYHKDE